MKKQFIEWAKKINPNIEKYKITERKGRYGIDVRIYTGEFFEITNKKSSFRRKEKVVDEVDKENRVVKFHYVGTTGHHTKKIPVCTLINEEDWDFKNKKPKDEDSIITMNSELFDKNYQNVIEVKLVKNEKFKNSFSEYFGNPFDLINSCLGNQKKK